MALLSSSTVDCVRRSWPAVAATTPLLFVRLRLSASLHFSLEDRWLVVRPMYALPVNFPIFFWFDEAGSLPWLNDLRDVSFREVAQELGELDRPLVAGL